MARLDVSQWNWETWSTLGTSSLRSDNAKNEKLKIFPFLAFRTHWISPMVKCALHVISGKAERVSTSDDPTIKFQNLSSLITSSHKNPKRENRAKRRPDFCFSNEKRGSVHYWKIITNWLGWKSKKGIWKGGKNGDFWGVFPCIYY